MKFVWQRHTKIIMRPANPGKRLFLRYQYVIEGKMSLAFRTTADNQADIATHQAIIVYRGHEIAIDIKGKLPGRRRYRQPVLAADTPIRLRLEPAALRQNCKLPTATITTAGNQRPTIATHNEKVEGLPVKHEDKPASIVQRPINKGHIQFIAIKHPSL